jgi:S1-C subfamily serine protease
MENNFGKNLVNFLVIVGLAVAAGAAGAAVIVRSATSNSEVVIVGNQNAPAAEPAKSSADLGAVGETQRDTVRFYRARPGTGLDGVFLPSDLAGEGVTLTSDGWVMSAAGVFAGPNQLVAVFADNVSATVPLSAVVKDDATGLAFVRLELDHLAVAAFGDDTALSPGETVYAPTGDGLGAYPVLAVRELPVSARADLVESSEKLSRRLMLADANPPPGAPVIDPSGKVVAVYAGAGAAVPAPYFTGALDGLFRDRKIIRPVLGARYLSLADAAASPAAGLASAGALITSGGKNRAVAAGSPAEAAGLREGDVIIAVERDRIEKATPLAELISEYDPGAKLELTVMRAGSQIKTSVTLGPPSK